MNAFDEAVARLKDCKTAEEAIERLGISENSPEGWYVQVVWAHFAKASS